MREKFEQDDKLDQMNAQKRRMKQAQHKREIDKQAEDRRKLLEKQLESEQEILRKEQELEAYKKQVIEQERQRLLREHATKLLGFLPKVEKYTVKERERERGGFLFLVRCTFSRPHLHSS